MPNDVRRQPSRRDDRDRRTAIPCPPDRRTLCSAISNALARFRVWKRCFVHRKRLRPFSGVCGVVIAIYAAGVPVCARRAVARILELHSHPSIHQIWSAALSSPASHLLTLAAPFELTDAAAAPAAPVGQQPRSGGLVCVCLRRALALVCVAPAAGVADAADAPWMALLARDGRRRRRCRRCRG